tara:strand:- start:23 stop:238 length:216 start_codon:yes stop_codon:yes gene_type:complete
MTLKSECEASVFSFAPLHKQLNAQLFDEHKDYVSIVITLHRDEYDRQKESGESSFSLPKEMQQLLNDMKPW